MPSQTKKKDNVSKNMQARYAPIEGALRSKPHTITLDLSGSSNYSATGRGTADMFGAPVQPLPKFYNPQTHESQSGTGVSIFFQPAPNNSPIGEPADKEAIPFKKEKKPTTSLLNFGEPKAKKVHINEPTSTTIDNEDHMEWDTSTGPQN